MLLVTGAVQIANPADIRKWPTDHGVMLEFEAVSVNVHERPAQLYHRHTICMWIPEKEVEGYVSKLKPGAAFFIEVGFLTMKEKPNIKHPIPEIKVERESFLALPITAPAKKVSQQAPPMQQPSRATGS